MELVHQETEAAVGDYNADLVLIEEGTDQRIIVENMFNRTDHDHLGKLITYMAGLGARYAILLAPLRYGAAFGKDRLRVEAYIDTGEKERTKKIRQIM